MAKTKLHNLNEYLFGQLERLDDDDMDMEKLQKESLRSKNIAQISSQIVSAGHLTLKVAMAVDQSVGDLKDQLPPMLNNINTVNVKNLSLPERDREDE
jgi:hypothetical protein